MKPDNTGSGLSPELQRTSVQCLTPALFQVKTRHLASALAVSSDWPAVFAFSVSWPYNSLNEVSPRVKSYECCSRPGTLARPDHRWKVHLTRLAGRFAPQRRPSHRSERRVAATGSNQVDSRGEL